MLLYVEIIKRWQKALYVFLRQCFMAIVGKYIHIFICIYVTELQEGYIPRKNVEFQRLRL